MRKRSIVVALVAIAWFALPAYAVDSSALINEALDKIVKLDLDATLPDALKAIENQTGVPLRAGREVYEVLPWGEQTNIKAKIENQTLRQALAAITSNLGLTFDTGDEAVELRPSPPLQRIGRRATVDELFALHALGQAPLYAAPPATASAKVSIAKLAEMIDARLVELKLTSAVEFRAGDAGVGEQNVSVSKSATLLDALEELTKQSRATWYPWGKSVVILPKEDHVRSLLNQVITVRYNGVDVAQVLTELSRRSGVAFTIEPGAVQRIAPEARVVKLVFENVPVRQALEGIAGFTGLGYVANENGVYVWNPSPTVAPAVRDRVVGILQMPGGTQLMLTESQLPPDVKEYLDAQRAAAITALRDEMKKSGFKSAAQPTGSEGGLPPATRPTTNEDL